MKLQIDTTTKTIRIEQLVSILEFIAMVKKLLPNDEWKEYSLEMVTIINNWSNPIVIDRLPYQPFFPTIQPQYPYTVCETTKGIFNLELTN